MEYETTYKKEMQVMGLEIRTSNVGNKSAHEILKTWEKFYAEKSLDKIPNKISDQVLGLYTDYEGDDTDPFSLIVGCEVDKVNHIPDGMVVKTIPASKYAVIKIKGDYPQSLINTWRNI